MKIAIQFRPHRRRSRLAATVVTIGERATLAASLDGKPVTEFEITIYQSGEKNARGLASNQNATLTLPKLHRATYTIYVRTAKNFCGFLCLDLSKGKNDAKDSFSAARRPLLPHEPTVQELSVAKYVRSRQAVTSFCGCGSGSVADGHFGSLDSRLAKASRRQKQASRKGNDGSCFYTEF